MVSRPAALPFVCRVLLNRSLPSLTSGKYRSIVAHEDVIDNEVEGFLGARSRVCGGSHN